MPHAAARSRSRGGNLEEQFGCAKGFNRSGWSGHCAKVVAEAAEKAGTIVTIDYTKPT